MGLVLKEWAYAGFFFDLVLGVGAHFMVGDGGYAPVLAGVLLLFASYFPEK